jgi:nucleoside-diphosphate-sugar epimerase
MQDRIWDSSIWVADVDKAKRSLNWQAKTALDQGLMQTMDWFKRQ